MSQSSSDGGDDRLVIWLVGIVLSAVFGLTLLWVADRAVRQESFQACVYRGNEPAACRAAVWP